MLLTLSQDLTNLLLAASKFSDYGLFHYNIAQMGITVSEKNCSIHHHGGISPMGSAASNMRVSFKIKGNKTLV
jgi:hypothetical protein